MCSVTIREGHHHHKRNTRRLLVNLHTHFPRAPRLMSELMCSSRKSHHFSNAFTSKRKEVLRDLVIEAV